jgi:hypothetical protein
MKYNKFLANALAKFIELYPPTELYNSLTRIKNRSLESRDFNELDYERINDLHAIDDLKAFLLILHSHENGLDPGSFDQLIHGRS